MSEFRWEAPPPRTKRKYHAHPPIARRLRANKGEWAMVALCSSERSARVMASTIRLGKVLAYMPAGDFEAEHSTVDGEFRVYARFLGDGADE